MGRKAPDNRGGLQGELKKDYFSLFITARKNEVFGSKFMGNGHCSVHSTWPSSNKGILKQPIKIEIQRSIFMPLQCQLCGCWIRYIAVKGHLQ